MPSILKNYWRKKKFPRPKLRSHQGQYRKMCALLARGWQGGSYRRKGSFYLSFWARAGCGTLVSEKWKCRALTWRQFLLTSSGLPWCGATLWGGSLVEGFPGHAQQQGTWSQRLRRDRGFECFNLIPSFQLCLGLEEQRRSDQAWTRGKSGKERQRTKGAEEGREQERLKLELRMSSVASNCQLTFGL